MGGFLGRFEEGIVEGIEGDRADGDPRRSGGPSALGSLQMIARSDLAPDLAPDLEHLEVYTPHGC